MTRKEELIEFALWLDKGTEYFGKSYIEKKADEWLKIRNNLLLPNGEKVLEALNKLIDTLDDADEERKTIFNDE